MVEKTAKKELAVAQRYSLYDMSDELIRLDQEMEFLMGDVTDGTRGAEIAKRMEFVNEMMVKKVDRVYEFIRSLETHRDALDAEIKSLMETRTVDDNKVKRVKAYALDIMVRLDRDVLAGDVHQLKKTGNGGVSPLEFNLFADAANPDAKPLPIPVDKYPEKFIKRDPAIDEKALRDALSPKDPEGMKQAVAEIEIALAQGDKKAETIARKKLEECGQVKDSDALQFARLLPRGFHVRVK